MTFDFNKLVTIGFDKWKTAPFRFYGEKEPFFIGNKVEQTWQDIILHGNTALTLVNAKANSLEYLKLFGDTEQLPETYLDTVTLSGGCEQRNLPSGFTQVEYLGSNSQAYIDTGVEGDNNNLEIGCTFSYSNRVTYGAVYGNYVSDNDNSYRVILGDTTNSVYVNVNTQSGSGGTTTRSCTINTINKTTIKRFEYTINSNTSSLIQKETGITNNNKICLFNRSLTNPNTTRDIGLKVYDFYIKDNNVLVCNLIPCRRNSDNELGMYDTVTNTFLTNQGTGTFTAGADVVPTPDTPMDIVSNNGVVKVRNKSGLPLGFTQVEYLQSSGTQYIDTGYVMTSNVVEYGVKCYGAPTISTSIFGSESSNSPKYSGVPFNSSTDIRLFIGNRGSLGPVNFKQNDWNTYIVKTSSSTDVEIIFNGDSTTLNYTGGIQKIYSIYLFANNKDNEVVQRTALKIASFYIKDNGVIVRNLIPCRRNSDSVLGMYDTVTNTFLTNAGTGTFTAGNTVSDPIEIYVDGTQEVVTDSLGNTANAEMLLAVGAYKDTQEVLSGSVNRQLGIYVLDGTENWSKSSTYTGSFYTSGIAPPDGTKVANNSGVYCTHGFKVDNLIEYSSATIGAIYWYSAPTINYKYDDGTATVEQFKQWLADQYNAGSPVTIVYPLATATTSTVTGQFLSKSPVTQTAGSISGLPIAITESSHTTPTPQQPLQINCNNGVVKVSKNLWSVYEVAYLNDQGSAISYTGFGCTDYIEVTAGEAYTFYENVTSQYTGNAIRVCFYDSNKTFISPRQGVGAVFKDEYLFKTTAPSNAKYVRCSSGADSSYVSDIIFKRGNYTKDTIKQTIYTDGTTETVEITGKNLFDKDVITEGYYYNAQLEYTANQDASLPDFIPVIAGEDYTISGYKETAGSFNIRVNYFNANKEIQSQVVQQVPQGSYSFTVTIPNGISYLRYSFRIGTQDSQQVELGSTATTYEPYFNGGTATAENLLKIGDYQDVQSILDGGVTRNVGVKVFDGTEKWIESYPSVIIQGATANWGAVAGLGGFCTHLTVLKSSETTFAGSCRFATDFNIYEYKTAFNVQNSAQFKTYLASQYNAGTPVIVVYPTSSPTTETVTAQPMNIQAGTNIVQITQASMDDLELEVKYKAGVSVTITEIENAQLDDNVEVTING